MGHLDIVEHGLHGGVEILGPEDVVVAPAIDHEGRDMAGYGRPVDVRVPSGGASGSSRARRAGNAGNCGSGRIPRCRRDRRPRCPYFLDQERDEIAAIALAVALDAADLVEKAGQDAGVGGSHAGEGVGLVRLTLFSISGWLASKAHLCMPSFASWMSPSEERSVVAVVHDLADGGAGAIRHHAVDPRFHSTSSMCRETPFLSASNPLDSSRLAPFRTCYRINKQRSRVSSISLRYA